MAAVTAHATDVQPEQPEPVAVLGIDETRRGRPRWRQNPETEQWEVLADCFG
jgi:hypothetical protein